MSTKTTRGNAHGAIRRVRAQLRKNAQLTLPSEVRQALDLAEGDEIEFAVGADGDVVVRGMTVIPSDQKWFWTEAWQAGEREASAELAAGAGTDHADVDAMFDHLRS
jgi:AbrB family looped-hinge helix DNA binding protein